jgi:hypothetical protein
MEKDNKSDYMLAASSGTATLPDGLQKIHDAFKDHTPGEFIWGGRNRY